MSGVVPVTPRAAAAIVLMRSAPQGKLEVFMVRRHIQSDFVPDVFVFPGGSVVQSDREAELTPGLCAEVESATTALGSGFHAAAVRECFEEAGVLLARRDGATLAIGPDDFTRYAGYRTALQGRATSLGAVAEAEHLTIATDALLHWAHWITPETFPKRFDTHFFLAQMPSAQEAAHDQVETTAGVWINPGEAMEQFEAGTFPLVFAQIHQLRDLATLSSLDEARTRFAGVEPRTIMPHVVQRDGADVILLPDES